MNTTITILETVQICDVCGRKMPKGKQALKLKDTNLYFCNKHCLSKKINEKFKELKEDNRGSFAEIIQKERTKVMGVPKKVINDLLENGAIETKEKLTKDDREDLIAYLEEYLKIFKNKKVHTKAHKKEPCSICLRAEELLKKLKG